MEYKYIYVRIDDFTVLIAHESTGVYYTEHLGWPTELKPNGELVWEKANKGYKTELFNDEGVGFDCFTSHEDAFGI